MTVVIEDTAVDRGTSALLLNLLVSMRGYAHLRVEQTDGTVTVGRLLENCDTDPSSLLRVRDRDGGKHTVDLADCRSVTWTDDVPF